MKRVRIGAAIPRRRDRWALWRRLRRVVRATKAEQKAAMSTTLGRLVAAQVLISRVTPGPDGVDDIVEFADGTCLRLNLGEGRRALRRLTHHAAYSHVHVQRCQPCFGEMWFWLRLASIDTGETAELLAKVRPSCGSVAGTGAPRPRWPRRHHQRP